MQGRKPNVTAWIAAGLLLVLSHSAVAIPIHVTAGGFFLDPASPLVPDGAEWSLDLVYESSTLDALPEVPVEGVYNAYQSLQLSIGDEVYTLGELTADGSNVRIFDDRTSYDGVTFRDVVAFRGSIASTLLGFNLFAAFAYPQPGGGLLSSDALSSDPAQLVSMFTDRQDPYWQYTDFVFYEMQPGQTSTSVFAVGTVDRFSATQVSVPEPGSLPLLSLGLLLMTRLRWRRTAVQRKN